MQLVKVHKNGTKEYRVQETHVDHHGKKYDVDYIVVKEANQQRKPTGNSFGTLDETFNKDIGEYDP